MARRKLDCLLTHLPALGKRLGILPSDLVSWSKVHAGGQSSSKDSELAVLSTSTWTSTLHNESDAMSFESSRTLRCRKFSTSGWSLLRRRCMQHLSPLFALSSSFEKDRYWSKSTPGGHLSPRFRSAGHNARLALSKESVLFTETITGSSIDHSGRMEMVSSFSGVNFTSTTPSSGLPCLMPLPFKGEVCTIAPDSATKSVSRGSQASAVSARSAR
mmetsp:Transcript_65153/g.113583  ORF Transcript_65153/g.113583 Transcript_65153/m.113583 type:complete len:216 (-) Transcript_65153:132-779(-)